VVLAARLAADAIRDARPGHQVALIGRIDEETRRELFARPAVRAREGDARDGPARVGRFPQLQRGKP
jgi:hypothetical protein